MKRTVIVFSVIFVCTAILQAGMYVIPGAVSQGRLTTLITLTNTTVGPDLAPVMVEVVVYDREGLNFSPLVGVPGVSGELFRDSFEMSPMQTLWRVDVSDAVPDFIGSIVFITDGTLAGHAEVVSIQYGDEWQISTIDLQEMSDAE